MMLATYSVSRFRDVYPIPLARAMASLPDPSAIFDALESILAGSAAPAVGGVSPAGPCMTRIASQLDGVEGFPLLTVTEAGGSVLGVSVAPTGSASPVLPFWTAAVRHCL